MRLIFLISIAMLAFAANSVLCRLALKETAIDAASFTLVRVLSGALVLCLLVAGQQHLANKKAALGGNWVSAAALFLYAACFSFSYISLPTGTGALLLFGTVQLCMISYGVFQGETYNLVQKLGSLLAILGLVVLLLPGISAPPLVGSLLMVLAGVGWGVYSLRGKGSTDPSSDTAGNFLRATPFCIALSLVAMVGTSLDTLGLWYAVLSGALASGLGYAIWYAALPLIKSTTAATVQLSVPVIAAFAGVIFLAEPLDARLVIAALGILGGIMLVLTNNEIKRGAIK